MANFILTQSLFGCSNYILKFNSEQWDDFRDFLTVAHGIAKEFGNCSGRKTVKEEKECRKTMQDFFKLEKKLSSVLKKVIRKEEKYTN